MAHLTAAPHRPLFLAGTLQTLLVILWWGFTLETRQYGTTLATQIPETAAHGWLMIYGLFPFFIFGFLFTALPNWVESGKIAQRDYLGSAGLMALGAGLFYPGLHVPYLAGIALILHALGWSIGLLALSRILRGAKHPDMRQPWLAWAATATGLAGALAFLGGAMLDSAPWMRAALAVGVWGFLIPLFLAVCHRMIPWFTSRIVPNYVIVRPHGPLWAMVAASLCHGVMVVLELERWTWLIDLPSAGLAVWFIARWGIVPAMRERLLAMLHIGFVWSAVSLTLHGLDSLLAFAGAEYRLGLAPMHALGIGFFGSMLLAMASRVTLGHSGRPLKADALTWGLFWMVQLIALTRMLPDLLPGLIAYRAMNLAVLLWLATFGIWAWKYAPIYWRARADGKPG